ncbi:MAG TPA: hypothetical protein VLA19_16470 [Herpetosiphonaceae bacterium]|nr:hypothetical protein [Herpetosiphonaceae bacterium]
MRSPPDPRRAPHVHLDLREPNPALQELVTRGERLSPPPSLEPLNTVHA